MENVNARNTMLSYFGQEIFDEKPIWAKEWKS